MPRFFFNLAGGASYERDDVGIDLDTVESAYFEAYRGALDIGIELLRARKKSEALRFEVVSDTGQLVFELPFSEVMNPGGSGRPRLGPHGALADIGATVARCRQLKTELLEQIAAAKMTLASTRTTLNRTRS